MLVALMNTPERAEVTYITRTASAGGGYRVPWLLLGVPSHHRVVAVWGGVGAGVFAVAGHKLGGGCCWVSMVGQVWLRGLLHLDEVDLDISMVVE